jgi:hypothetical protein
MTYAGLCEVALHLNDFKISDPYGEGYYRLRISIYYEKPDQLVEEDQTGKSHLVSGGTKVSSAHVRNTTPSPTSSPITRTSSSTETSSCSPAGTT